VPAPADPTRLPRAQGALPSTAPIPRAGKLFMTVLTFGTVFLGFGLMAEMPLFTLAGGILLGIVALALIVGHHVS
jgi:small neutral amino acid transporter SnatA (MarC family)